MSSSSSDEEDFNSAEEERLLEAIQSNDIFSATQMINGKTNIICNVIFSINGSKVAGKYIYIYIHIYTYIYIP